ncbi:MAG: DUF1289 domain-containing protein [Burkholderiaceae bacterium]
MKLQPEPASPCISICQLDDNGLCTGCLRTIDEITAWGTLGADGKRQILAAVESRRLQTQPATPTSLTQSPSQEGEPT